MCKNFSMNIKKHWQEIRKIHFHPQTGSVFWLERAQKLKLNVFEEVQDIGTFGSLEN